VPVNEESRAKLPKSSGSRLRRGGQYKFESLAGVFFGGNRHHGCVKFLGTVSEEAKNFTALVLKR